MPSYYIVLSISFPLSLYDPNILHSSVLYRPIIVVCHFLSMIPSLSLKPHYSSFHFDFHYPYIPSIDCAAARDPVADRVSGTRKIAGTRSPSLPRDNGKEHGNYYGV